MSIPELGPILTTNNCYMFALYGGVTYSATLVFVEGQTLPSFIFDPRMPTSAFINFTNNTSSMTMTARNTNISSLSNIGYVNGVLDVTVTPSNINPVTTDANDDYFPESNVAVLTGIGYNIFYNSNATPFNAYVPGLTSGTIKLDTNGNPVIQTIYGKFYFFSITWYPLNNCSVTLSDVGTIQTLVNKWLVSGIMPSTQYFTTPDLCTVQNVFTYCPFRNSCTTTCNGPCLDPNQDCTFNSSSQIYSCTGPTENPTNLTPYYSIIILLGIVAFVLLVAFLVDGFK